MQSFVLKIKKTLIFFPILFFAFFAFYNLNWGAPFYFHPDERNIASAVSQLNLDNLNPHFFAYGALPIYSIYVVGGIENSLIKRAVDFTVLFEQAIIIGRFFSALLSIFLIGLIYLFTKSFFGKAEAIIATLLGTGSVAYLQFSHFATFEIWLSFFSLLMLYLFCIFVKSKQILFFILGAAVFGILCALKASSLILALIPLLVIIHSFFVNHEKLNKKLFYLLKLLTSFAYFSFVFYFISAPFNFLDQQSFISSMNYERNVALGTLPVFYTGSFANSVPIIFQYQKLLPFLINPLNTIISIAAIIYCCFIFYKKRNVYLGLVLLSFFILFIFNSLLFVKWTRYLVPSIAPLYIIISIFISGLSKKINKHLFKSLLIFLFFINFLYAFSFIKTVLLSQDSRIQAVNFARKNISPSAIITADIYDLGIVPFNDYFQNITLFNYYDLDNGPDGKIGFDKVFKSDIIILPSQRIYESRVANNKKFPIAYSFYKNLFSGKSGFEKIYQTPCDIFCKITYLGDPVFNVEETSNVFDRPNVFIFKKK